MIKLNDTAKKDTNANCFPTGIKTIKSQKVISGGNLEYQKSQQKFSSDNVSGAGLEDQIQKIKLSDNSQKVVLGAGLQQKFLTGAGGKISADKKEQKSSTVDVSEDMEFSEDEDMSGARSIDEKQKKTDLSYNSTDTCYSSDTGEYNSSSDTSQVTCIENEFPIRKSGNDDNVKDEMNAYGKANEQGNSGAVPIQVTMDTDRNKVGKEVKVTHTPGVANLTARTGTSKTIVVTVQGRMYTIDQITPQLQDEMTDEEAFIFVDAFQKFYGDLYD